MIIVLLARNVTCLLLLTIVTNWLVIVTHKSWKVTGRFLFLPLSIFAKVVEMIISLEGGISSAPVFNSLFYEFFFFAFFIDIKDKLGYLGSILV